MFKFQKIRWQSGNPLMVKKTDGKDFSIILIRSTWLHRIIGTGDLSNSACTASFIPTFFNTKGHSRGSRNISNHIFPASHVRRLSNHNVDRTSSVRPKVQNLSQGQRSSSGMRVYVLSDLHTDYPENMEWVKSLSDTAYKADILIIAGDVAEKIENFVLTMSVLKERFRDVFFVPGNHDLWCRRKQDPFFDSVEKLSALMEICSALDIATEPKIINGVGIVPLFSWYHQSFDKERDITDGRIMSLQMACKDFHACKWPPMLSSYDMSLARYFDELNFKQIEAIQEIQMTRCQIITFSHFLPRPELCPEKRMLFYPNLPKVIGSDLLEVWLRNIHGPNGSKSACHVFGHSHFFWDALLDGIRYIQAPLAYPRERKRRMNEGERWLPFCIYDSDHGGLQNNSLPCFWSKYYHSHKRNPENIDLAPWVLRRTKKF